MALSAAARARSIDRDRRRIFELKKCQNNLWYLLTKYLSYGWNPTAADKDSPFPGRGLTKRFHKPICDWLDANRGELYVGFWFSRWHHKSTIAVGQVIQDILRNPNITLFYFHAVDDEAKKFVSEVAHHLQHNEKLRKLEPIGMYPRDYDIKELAGRPYNIMPGRTAKKWATADRFTLKRSRFSRFPTLLGKGQTSEITGAHADKAYLDDVISRNTIADNSLPKVTDWFENTVLPVVDGGIIRASGTPWSDWGLYHDWWTSPDWVTLKAAASVKEKLPGIDWTQKKIHLTPDYEFERPTYGPESYRKVQQKRLKSLQRQMKNNFPPQMMVDPSPAGEKKWDPETCETRISLLEAKKGKGRMFVLSDPAPAKEGSQTGATEKSRGDGSKDEWALAVVRIRVMGDIQQIILMQGKASRDWTRTMGFDQAMNLMHHWRTDLFFNESYGGLVSDYDLEIKKAARRCHVNIFLDENGQVPKYANSYAGGAKNQRFGALADMASRGEFLICESVDQEFLEDPNEGRLGLLHQVRNWRDLPNGRNSNKYDDRADVVSRSTDAALQNFAPLPMINDDLYEDEADEDTPTWSRYCAV